MKLRLKRDVTFMAKAQRICGDFKITHPYLLWSIDGLAAAPHCGIVGDHIIHCLSFLSPTASLQLLTPRPPKVPTFMLLHNHFVSSF
ncbi:hypothetical protein VNO77_09760 [Canavalia gladiata]|uniref:Uncharacterized protein n=1 Tax=Canavalia gladiata TaxID=3824 RepID=A0AAN9MB35_CANGL